MCLGLCETGWSRGKKVGRMAAVSLGEYECALMHARAVFVCFFSPYRNIPDSSVRQKKAVSRQSLCGKPKSWPSPPNLPDTHSEKHTRAFNSIQTWADRMIWIFEKGLRQQKKKNWYRPWIWYHKYIVCISHGPVSWSLYVCVCVVNSALYLSRAHLLSITSFPSPTPLFTFCFSLSVTNPACVGLDNKLSGEEKAQGDRDGWFFLPNGHIDTRTCTHAQTEVTALVGSHGTATLVRPIMRHDIPPSRGQKPLYLCLSLS